MWFEEVVMTSENIQLPFGKLWAGFFEELLNPSVAGCSSSQKRRRLPDRQIEPLNEGSVECLGILLIQESLIEIPVASDDHSAVYFSDSVVSSSLDDLGIVAFANSALIKFVSVGGD